MLQSIKIQARACVEKDTTNICLAERKQSGASHLKKLNILLDPALTAG